jgi:hypothetical protein
VFSFSPTVRAVLLFADDASAVTARALPAVVRRFDAAPAAVLAGVRLPRAVRSVPVPSSSVSAARLVFPRAARAVVRGASGDSARSAVPSGGLSSAGAGASCFLDLAPARRLVVTGAGAGTTSTDRLRFLAPRRGPFAGSGSGSGSASGSGLAAGVVPVFLLRTVLRADLLVSAGSPSVAVDPVDFVAARERRVGPGSGPAGFGSVGMRSATSGATSFLALLASLVGAGATSWDRGALALN